MLDAALSFQIRDMQGGGRGGGWREWRGEGEGEGKWWEGGGGGGVGRGRELFPTFCWLLG
jgi:hypothetical protein